MKPDGNVSGQGLLGKMELKGGDYNSLRGGTKVMIKDHFLKRGWWCLAGEKKINCISLLHSPVWRINLVKASMANKEDIKAANMKGQI